MGTPRRSSWNDNRPAWNPPILKRVTSVTEILEGDCGSLLTGLADAGDDLKQTAPDARVLEYGFPALF
jgi:hypothetical protein